MAGHSEQADQDPNPALAETRRRKETKERLLAAALEVFTTSGVAAASIEQISEAAGFTRGAFYSNFSSKEDLLLALLAQEQHSAIWQAESALGAAIGESKPETMEALHSTVLDSLATLPDCGRTWLLMRREIQLAALRDEEVARKFMATETVMYERIASLLDETLNHVGRESLVASSDLARLLVAVFDWSEQERALEDPNSLPATGLFARVLSTMLSLLTAKAG